MYAYLRERENISEKRRNPRTNCHHSRFMVIKFFFPPLTPHAVKK